MSQNGSTPRRGVCSFPQTSLGKASVIMVLVVLALIAMNVIFFDAPNEVGPAWLGDILRAAIGLSLAVGLALGGVALTIKRECSWVVWLSTALPLLVLGFEVFEMLAPGQ